MGLASVGFHWDLCAEATPNQWFRFEIPGFRSVPNQVLYQAEPLPDGAAGGNKNRSSNRACDFSIGIQIIASLRWTDPAASPTSFALH
jgi:hypothetical protein